MAKFISKVVLCCVILDTAFTAVFGAYCSGKPEVGERISTLPIHDEVKPRLIHSVKNAMLFEAGPKNYTFPIVHIWGNPYEIGNILLNYLYIFIQACILNKFGNFIIQSY